MGYTVTYRTCLPVSAREEAAVRAAVDAFNQGQSWVLSLFRNERDGHLVCEMQRIDVPDGEVAGQKWPGAYEGQRLLDGLCVISRDCAVDWEIHDTYCLRPIGYIRRGVCHPDEEARLESLRIMGEEMDRRSNP